MYSDGATLVINHYCYYYGVVVDDAAGDVGIASSPESVVAQVGRFSAWTKAPVEKSGPKSWPMWNKPSGKRLHNYGKIHHI